VLLPSRVERKKRGNSLLYHSAFSTPVRARKHKVTAKAEVYWSDKIPVDLYSFDAEYLRRLGAHDRATEEHFAAYFGERLKIILRAGGIDSHTIEDIKQETFCRVLAAIRAGHINNPSGFGAYVHAVCRNVRLEAGRETYRNQHESLEYTDVPDDAMSLEEIMQLKQNGQLVREILAELPERDRHLLQARFFDDRDNEDVCGDFGVDRDYLRVLFHRAINRFGDLYKKKSN
jgi:RNA polymerase sigma-70 factor, ECF subfamily